MKQELEDVLLKSTILLVEDEEDVRKSFKKVLSLWVKEVYEAKDGQEGLEFYHKLKPDIIITDVKMPRLDGIELSQAIRQTNKTIPIVITSAYTDKDYLLKSIKLYLMEYLVKPIQENELIQTLENCAKVLKPLKQPDDYFYDQENKSIIFQNKEVLLTPKEADFIELLLEHKGNLVEKKLIEHSLYIYEEAPISALKNLVFKLRKKLDFELIKSVGRHGYQID